MQTTLTESKTTRKRRTPSWLLESFITKDIGDVDSASIEPDAICGDSIVLSDAQSFRNRGHIEERPDNVGSPHSIWLSLAETLDRRIASLSRQNFDGEQGQTSGIARQISGKVSDSSDDDYDPEGTVLGPSKILEIPTELLARILSCLPINILLQASGVSFDCRIESYLPWYLP